MSKLIFRSPNINNNNKAFVIDVEPFKLEDKRCCNHCGKELTQKETVPSTITVHKKEKEGSKDKHKTEYVISYLCFNCIEKLTGRRPDHE